METPLLILIAGPYRSGTNGDPDAIARNLARLEEAAWPIFRRGHVPMIGEWVALPVLRGVAEAAQADEGGDVMYETAARLLEHCDAVLRLPGESSGADTDVAIARRRGIPVYFDLDEIPQLEQIPPRVSPSATRIGRTSGQAQRKPSACVLSSATRTPYR
ncbi:DUF4406 domain-containing protein [Agromyces sp. ISL-38]|uniref:DUF4406 domain-containing protein n=1 Tax=Agromyces sp. ISL-38 TaxID=2819107 RepID=UPI002034F3B7|nr:DUF4406 domain-containing protein [Agromyces sp. ISL-38]